MRLNNVLKRRFKTSINHYHQSLWKPLLTGEADFINRTLKSFKSLTISAGKQTLKTRSKRIHVTPSAEYYPLGRLFPNIHKRVEMGNLLFTYKHLKNGLLKDHRAVVIQAKYTREKQKSWKIDADQLHFLTYWPDFRIVSPLFKKWYHIKPRALTWATYGFVGPNATKHPLYYSSTRIFRHKRTFPSTKIFSFPLGPRTGWDSSTSYLLKFVQGLTGENLPLNRSIKAFVNDLYSMAKWKPDLPRKPRWNNLDNEERKSFGIVEFNMFTEEAS